MRRAIAFALILLGLPVVALAEQDVVHQPSVAIQDEGAAQGRARTLNCTGAGISCSVSGGVGTLSVSGGGGGGGTWTAVEIDFSLDPTTGAAAGSRFVQTKSVTDAAVSATSKLVIAQSGIAATGRQADENEMDAITCRGIPASGSFTLICSLEGSVTHGLFKVHYSVN